jgi:hypothetical protein
VSIPTNSGRTQRPIVQLDENKTLLVYFYQNRPEQRGEAQLFTSKYAAMCVASGHWGILAPSVILREELYIAAILTWAQKYARGVHGTYRQTVGRQSVGPVCEPSFFPCSNIISPESSY